MGMGRLALRSRRGGALVQVYHVRLLAGGHDDGPDALGGLSCSRTGKHHGGATGGVSDVCSPCRVDAAGLGGTGQDSRPFGGAARQRGGRRAGRRNGRAVRRQPCAGHRHRQRYELLAAAVERGQGRPPDCGGAGAQGLRGEPSQEPRVGRARASSRTRTGTGAISCLRWPRRQRCFDRGSALGFGRGIPATPPEEGAGSAGLLAALAGLPAGGVPRGESVCRSRRTRCIPTCCEDWRSSG